MTHILVEAAEAVPNRCRVIAANTNADAWRWSKTKVKTDQKDCERLIKLFRIGELQEVYVPESSIREVRRLIMHRGRLVSRRAGCYNAIRSLCKRHQVSLPSGEAAWSAEGLAHIESMTRDQAWAAQTHCSDPDIWLLELRQHLEAVRLLQHHIKEIERVINRELAKSPEAQALQTVPGVGPQIAAAIIAFVGSAKRFPSAKHIASYVGLAPRIYQSGKTERHGGISKAGNQRLRKLLVNGAWQAIRNPWAKAIFDRLTAGSSSRERRKKAIVAVARHMIIRCWAMLRDGTSWNPPPQPTA